MSEAQNGILDCTFVSCATGADPGLEYSSLTPNPFALEAAMAVPLPSGEKPSALECRDATGKKLGIWPMQRARMVPGIPVMRSPNVPLYETAGTPMIMAGREEAVLEAMVHSVRIDPSLPSVLFNQSMLAEGSVWNALQSLVRRGLITIEVIEDWERSILVRDTALSGEDYLMTQLSASKRKNLRRKTAGLTRKGKISLSVTRGETDILAAFERFCILEASGWKGKRKTAVFHHPTDAAYFRALMASMAASGHGFIAELVQDGRPIASGLFLCCGREMIFLRTAYDGRFAAFSPGVILDSMLTDHLYRTVGFDILDASTDGAVKAASMIWKQRRKMAHVVIDFTGGSASASGLVAAQRARLWLKRQKNRVFS
jgi:Acetyltransferase (GNAT) domain